MSSVSYPLPIKAVIKGGKTWGDCHLASLFRRARLKLAPDPAVTGYLPDLRERQFEESFAKPKPFEPKNPNYSPLIQSLFVKFQNAQEMEVFNVLYLFSKRDINSDSRSLEDSLRLKILPSYWSPSQVEKHLDLFDEGSVHQVLITLDLNRSFNVQLQNNGINPATFDDWSTLLIKPVNGFKPERSKRITFTVIPSV